MNMEGNAQGWKSLESSKSHFFGDVDMGMLLEKTSLTSYKVGFIIAMESDRAFVGQEED
jgi:hypothetical protein